MSQTNRRQTKSGRKAPSSRGGDIAEITKAVKEAHLRKFGRYTYVDRRDRRKRNV